MNFDDDAYDDRPTRSECEAEAFQEQVEKENHKFLMENNEWYKRAYEIIDGASPSLMATKLFKAIAQKIKKLEDDSFEDTKDAMMDEAAYNSDPMAYHGVSWSDFI